MLTIEVVWIGILVSCFVIASLLDGLTGNEFRDPLYPVISGCAGIAFLVSFVAGNWTLVAGSLLDWLPPGDELLRSLSALLILGFGSFALLLGCQFLLSLFGSFLRRVFCSKGDGHHV